MRGLIPSIFFGLMLAMVAPNLTSAEEPVSLPGTVWALVPPPGFAVITEPSALFGHPSGAFIVVQDMPKGPVTQADFDFAAEDADVRLIGLTEVTVDGKHGFLAVMRFTSDQATSVVLIVEGKESNGNIVAAIPDGASMDVSLDEMRKAVLTAVERPKATGRQLSDLPYELGAMSGMRVVHYKPGGILILTDGSLDDLERASGQSFIMISTLDTRGTTFDPPGDLGRVVQRVKQQYPDAQIVSSEIQEQPDGKFVEILYERTTRTSHEIVGGVIWAKPVGSSVLLMICQHPRGDQAAFARLEQLRDGVREKQAAE